VTFASVPLPSADGLGDSDAGEVLDRAITTWSDAKSML